MKLFIDNIPTLVTEVTLLAPIPRMFCPKVVYKMKPDMIAQIASESEEKKLEREELSLKLETLESGWGICRRHVARMKAGKLLFVHGPLLTFADLKIAVQTKSAGEDKNGKAAPPKSIGSEVAEPADEEIVKPEVPTVFELTKSGKILLPLGAV